MKQLYTCPVCNIKHTVDTHIVNIEHTHDNYTLCPVHLTLKLNKYIALVEVTNSNEEIDLLITTANITGRCIHILPQIYVILFKKQLPVNIANLAYIPPDIYDTYLEWEAGNRLKTILH